MSATVDSLTSVISRLRSLVFPGLPHSAAPDHFRFSAYLNFVAVLSFVGHCLFLPIFVHLGAKPMVLANLLSIPLFAVAWLLNRRNFCYTAMWLMLLEYVGHAWLAVRLVGWEFGFQYYTLGWAWVPFMAPPGRRATKLAAMLLGCGTFIHLTRFAGVSLYPPGSWQAREAVFINTGNIAFFCFAIAFSFIAFRNHIAVAEEAAREAYAQSQRLLHNILPHKIAERLKSAPEVIADTHASASVLFLDIVDFTPMMERMNPKEMVDLLNDIFSRLDALTLRYGIEKIKTIGDAHMVAAGVPEARGNHAEAIGLFALDALEVVRGFRDGAGGRMRARIGIDTGSAVAGVIGRHKFIYDLWGDMVNTASRMESHGLADAIQTTRRYRETAGDVFVFEPRGIVEIKGKGPMETYLLAGRREASGGR
jgi:class 3 adenylate cyclase